MSYLTELEKQQLQFDWRYKGVSILNLLTESEVDAYFDELEESELIDEENDKEGEWGEYDPYMYPHKESKVLTGLMKHPKVIGGNVNFWWVERYLVYKLVILNHQVN